MVCPDLEALEELAAGGLAAEDAGALEAHLETCPGCRRSFAEVAADREAVEGIRRVLAPDFEPGVPEALGPYRILRELGRGGMGVVYEAHDPRLERRVALKILPGRKADAVRLSRFEREAKLLASIQHPNIATVHSLEEDRGVRFLTMELVSGESLARRLARGRLPVDVALEAARQVARALEAAHARGIVHRDLKPDNVMCTPDGVVKVLDFGLARALSLGPARARAAGEQASGGEVSGTPGYMSPEQIRGDPIDPGTDVWALGALLYEILAGRPLFRGLTASTRAAATLSGTPAWDDLPPDTPGPIRDLLAACCEPDRTRRLCSAAEARRILEEELAHVALRHASARRAARAPGNPHNLPVRLDSFVGRTAMLAELERVLRGQRLVTLTGVGGCGKSRLGLELATRLLGSFHDGTWWVELAPLGEPDLVFSSVAQVLAIKERPEQGMLETLAESLAARELLLILDNCDHVLAPVAALAEALLRAAGVRIVSTSREPLGIRGECIVAVPSLSTPPRGGSWESALDSEAVRLFADRAAALDPGFALDRESADSVAQICRRLDGIPLALELAAARMTTLPADEILRRLDDRFRLLTGGSKTALPRHQTLSALFDWSHDLLSEPERALLRRLSVFAGGWTLDAVESVCAGGSIEDWMTVDLLSNLVQRSLVERDAGGTREGGKARYRMLETVRQYARDRLLESGEGEVIRRRHRSFFTALAEDLDQRLLGFGQKAALARFRVEHDNLLSALATEVKGQVDGETTLRLGGALGRFWGTEGFWTEGRRIYLEILSRPECGPRSSSRAKVCNWAGNLGTFMGDYDAGEALHEECLAIAREVGDAFYEASAYNNLGVVANYRGELERAEQLHRRSLELRSGLGQPWAVALSLYQLGTTHVRQRRLDAARPRLEEALEIMRKVGDGIAVAAALCSLGFLSLMEGDPAGARQRFEESLGMHRDHREAWGTALCLHGLGVALGRVGSTAEALASHRESLAIRLQIVDRQAVSTSLEAIGVLVATLQPELAVRLLGAAEAVRQRIRAGLSAWEMEDHDQATNRLRDVLGDERMATLWNQGRALSLEEAASATRQARPSASGR